MKNQNRTYFRRSVCFSIHAEENAVSALLRSSGLQVLLPLIHDRMRPSQLRKLRPQWLRARRLMNKREFIVERRTRDGSLAMAKPCASCCSMLRRFGLQRVTYTDSMGCYVEHKIADIQGQETKTQIRLGRANRL